MEFTRDHQAGWLEMFRQNWIDVSLIQMELGSTTSLTMAERARRMVASPVPVPVKVKANLP